MYSMQHYFDHTSRIKSMGTITQDHYPSYKKAKKSMKLKQFSNIGEEEEVINIM
jgi:hypothetical protein